MDLYTTGLVLAFCVAGAFVAYFADNLGRHLGKSRKTIFGLRPRHTATLLTTTAGFLVPLLTVGLLALTSSELRTILREGSRLRLQRDQLRNEKVDLDQKVNTQKRQLVAADQKAQDQQREIKVQSKTIKQNLATLESRKLEITRLSLSARSLKDSLGRLKLTLSSAQQRLTASQSQSRKLNQENQRIAAQSRNMSQNLATQRRQLNDANAEFVKIDTELRKKEKQADALIAQLDQLNKDKAALQKQNDQAMQQYTNNLVRLRTERDNLEAEMTRLQNMIEMASQNEGRVRLGDVMFPLNEELARQVVRPGATEAQARIALDAAVRAARNRARAQGADDNGPWGAAGFAELRDHPKAAQEEEAIRAITGTKVGKIIILRALWNSFKGESVPLRAEIRDNRLLYQAGAVILETRINGTRPESEIIDAVSKFVTKNVASKLRQDGILPSGDGTGVGSLSFPDLYQVVRDLQTEHRLIRLQILAKDDIYTVGPAEIAFRLR